MLRYLYCLLGQNELEKCGFVPKLAIAIIKVKTKCILLPNPHMSERNVLLKMCRCGFLTCRKYT